MYYFKDPKGNFGDDLNPWLWPKLLPKFFDEDSTNIFIGIGTLINHRVPNDPIKHVFGSGVGYGRVPFIDDKWRFHAVRGKLSANALGLPIDKAITDAAVLIRLVAPPLPAKRFRCGLIVTGHSLTQYDWSSVCEQAGIRFISCHWSVERVIRSMGECDLVLCEAMHGAIVADALRIPWIPVSLYGALLDFKWKDWLSSVEMEYLPTRVTSLHSPPPSMSLADKLQSQAKALLTQLGVYRGSDFASQASPTGQHELDRAVFELRRLSTQEGFLSKDVLNDRHVARYSELLKNIS